MSQPVSACATTFASSTTSRERPGLAIVNRIVLLVALTLAAYHNSFAGKMAFDDHSYLGREKFSELELHTSNSARPLLFWSLQFNHWLGGSNALGYHAFNLGIHVACGLTLFGLVHRSLLAPGCRGRFSPTLALDLAFVTALLWSVHPLTTQAVTYIIQRGESMASLFYVASLFGVACCATSRSGWARGTWGTATIVCCWLGLASKEIAVSIPIAAAIYDRVFYASSWREVAKQRGWVYLGQLSPFLWLTPRLVRVLFSAPGASAGFGLQVISPWEYAYNQPLVILHYLRLTFWPHPLCLDYVWQPVARGIDALLPGVLIVGLLLVTLLGLLRLRPWAWVSASFFLILAPTSSFIPIADLAFEHRMYLPLAGVLALVVIGLGSLSHSWRTSNGIRGVVARLLPWTAALLVVAAMTRTIIRNADYADPERLWRSVLAVAPHNPRAYSNLGGVLYEKGDHRQAAISFYEALRYRPRDDTSMFGLALSLDAIGRHEDAIRCFKRGIELKPDSSLAYNDMGTSHDKANEYVEAEAAYRRALEIEPGFAIAAYNLGSLLLRQARDVEAADLLERALMGDSPVERARRQLAWLYATTSDPSLRSPERALRLLAEVQASEKTPSARTLDALAAAEAAQGRFDQAVAATDAAVRLAQERQLLDLVDEIKVRQALYRQRLPFVRNRT